MRNEIIGSWEAEDRKLKINEVGGQKDDSSWSIKVKAQRKKLKGINLTFDPLKAFQNPGCMQPGGSGKG